MTETLTARQRAVLEARLMERLGRLDDGALLRVADFVDAAGRGTAAAPPPSGAQRGGWTRRQVIAGTVLGGAVVAGATTGAGVVGTVRGAAAAAAELREEANASLDRWQGLVALYERLESVDLDGAITGGLVAVAGALTNVQALTTRIREGLERAETTLAELDESLAVLDNGLAAAEQAITRLADAVQALEDRLESVGERVAPLGDALGSFFKGLIGKIPFGVGDRILATVEHVEAVVTTVPEAISSVNTELIGPLRQRFFPREGDNIRVRLFDPLVAALFDPADRLLGAVTVLTERWEAQLAQPADQGIRARAEIREAIAQYKAEHRLS